jgi:hypothetical protein
METKTCSICGKNQELSNFYIRTIKNGVPKYRTECKECYTFRVKKYAKNNPNKIKVDKRQYYQNNKNILDVSNKLWASKNPDKRKSIQKKYYDNNMSEILENQRIRYADHLEEEHMRSKKYKTAHKEEIKIKRAEASKQKRISSPEFKLKSNVSRSIRGGLKKNGGSKNGITFLKKIGYSIEDLRKHLEFLFEPWMSWSNWGVYCNKTWDDNDSTTWTWQIDHIVPHSAFKYSSMDDNDFKKCWSLNNLRPLSAKQNFLNGIELLKVRK